MRQFLSRVAVLLAILFGLGLTAPPDLRAATSNPSTSSIASLGFGPCYWDSTITPGSSASDSVSWGFAADRVLIRYAGLTVSDSLIVYPRGNGLTMPAGLRAGHQGVSSNSAGLRLYWGKANWANGLDLPGYRAYTGLKWTSLNSGGANRKWTIIAIVDRPYETRVRR